jgi:uncharacterized protein (TIGR03382 family)
MNIKRALLFAIPLLALAASESGDARACGGCFIATSESTEVTSHRMILSVSQTQTSLWDQIAYSGSPSSFAWVLPVKGMADLELSSDALFGNLDALTQVTVNAPALHCVSNFGGGGDGGSGGGYGNGGSGGGDGGGSAPPPVTVVSQKVVGPYETVQLSSTSPEALEGWLAQHGYNIPADVAPVVSAYVKEGFDFIALKLVPGAGVSAMRPVRVTTPGATPILPLRMVAAGTGVTTPITLWVVGEGRYEPVDVPTFQISEHDLVWDWDRQGSNYASLVQDNFQSSDGQGWLVEAGEPFTKYGLSTHIDFLARYNPIESGYGDDMGNGALQESQADLDALFATIPDGSLWVTRLRGELSRAALGADLPIGAAGDQSVVPRDLVCCQTQGTAPCEDDGTGTHCGGCAAGHTQHTSTTLLGGLAMLAASALTRRRPRAARRA